MNVFHSHANRTHFHKKGCALGLVLKVRVLGTRAWPTQLTVDLSLSAVHCCMRSPMFTNTVPATGLAAVYSPFTGRTCVMWSTGMSIQKLLIPHVT